MLNRPALERMIQGDRRHRLFRLAKQYQEHLRTKTLQEKAMFSAARAFFISRENAGRDPALAALELSAQNATAIYGEVLAENRFRAHMRSVVEAIIATEACRMVGDEEVHAVDVQKLTLIWTELLLAILTRNDALLTKGSFENYLQTNMELMSCMVNARADMFHALLISRSLEIDLGERIERLQGADPYKGLALGIECEGAQRAISGMRWKDENIIALILLKTLYPMNAERRLEEVTFRISAPMRREEPERVDALAEKVRELIDAGEEELREYRNEFGEDAEKIAKAISMAREGASKKLSVFAVENSLDDKVLSFMIDAEEMVCPLGVECEDVFMALENLSSENRDAMLGNREVMEKAAGWLALMPNYMREMPELAFLLGLHFDAPEEKASAHQFLVAHQVEFEDAMLRNGGDLGRFESDLEGFTGYLQGFVKADSKSEGPVAEDAPAPARQMRPHESLAFSEEPEAAMVAEGVQPEDMRRALAYGLRLSSKAARGKRYFRAQHFRMNTDRVLARNGQEVTARRESMEAFLIRHGVAAYKKAGTNLIRLNIADDSGVKPDKIGAAMLGDVVRWMQEFQRETAR